MIGLVRVTMESMLPWLRATGRAGRYMRTCGRRCWSRKKHIGAYTRHAARDDVRAEKARREDADPECLALAWRAGIFPASGKPLADREWRQIPTPPPMEDPTPAGERRPKRPRRPVPWAADIRGAIAERMAADGAQPHPRAGQPLALGLGIGVSVPWIEEGGDLYSPANPHNQALRRQVRAWLRHVFSQGLVTVRADYDEAGAGYIDAVVVPVLDMSFGGRPQKNPKFDPVKEPDEPEYLPEITVPTVAVTAALAALNRQYGHAPRARKFVALQDSWAEWAATYLDPRIQRGQKATVTRRRHMPTDEYTEHIEARKKEAAEADAVAATAVQHRDEILAEAAAVAAQATEIQTAAQDLIAATDDLPDWVRDELERMAGHEIPPPPERRPAPPPATEPDEDAGPEVGG